MGRRRHKRKNSHVVIVTSDAVDAGAKLRQFRIRPWVIQSFVLILSVFIGTVIGFYIYQRDNLVMDDAQTEQHDEETIAKLREENMALQIQVTDLSATVQVLSETVNQKTESESMLAEQLAQQSIPTEFPVTGSATSEEVTEGDPICIITATAGAMVVATAKGTVTAVNDDAEYGHNVWVDHGNGYVTVYRNQGEVKVKQGETVKQGSTLFLIDEENNRLGYQMMKDGSYINPMDMIEISG